jgi:hypothetical protein
MSTLVTDTFTDARAAFEALLIQSPDTCSIYNRTFTQNGDGGTTSVDGTAVATAVPIIYFEKKYALGMVAGGDMSPVTHELYLKATAINQAIATNYVIVVNARDNKSALRFEHPISLQETMGVGVVLGATLKL